MSEFSNDHHEKMRESKKACDFFKGLSCKSHDFFKGLLWRSLNFFKGLLWIAGYNFKKGGLMPEPMTDHEGRQFRSIAAMCRHWGLSKAAYWRRTAIYGMTMQEALTSSAKDCLGKQIKECHRTDHKGTIFPSRAAMCGCYGISVTTFDDRMSKGWTLEDALTKPKIGKAPDRSVKDHKGKKFPSIREMCKAYGLAVETYKGRLKAGWTQKNSLTIPTSEHKRGRRSCYDHKGKMFASVEDMCRHWKIPSNVYYHRTKKGWTLKKTLETPYERTRIETRTEFIDHKGQRFQSLKDMCKHWKISTNTFEGRRYAGWDLEKSLTWVPRKSMTGVTDPIGREFPSLQTANRYYGIKATFYADLYPSRDAALAHFIDYGFRKNRKIGNTKIIKPLGFPYYLVKTGTEQYITHVDDLLKKERGAPIIIETDIVMHGARIIQQMDFPYYLIEYDGSEEIRSYWELIGNS